MREVCFICYEAVPLVAELPDGDTWISICADCYEDRPSAIRFDDPDRIDSGLHMRGVLRVKGEQS